MKAIMTVTCAAAIISLSGCAGSPYRDSAELVEVRAIAIEAREMAEYAMRDANKALEISMAASEDSATAASAAQAASERADRIYRANMKK